MSDKRRAEQVDEVLDGLSSPSVADVSVAMREFDADDVAAAAAYRGLAGGGSSPAFASHSRPPADPASAVWTVELTGTPTDGTFTLMITVGDADPVETDPIDWDEVNFDDTNPSITTIIEAITGVGTTSAIGGPLPASIEVTFVGVAGNTTIDIEVGDNSLTGGTDPAPSLNQTTEGGPGDTGLPRGSGWWNSDDNLAYVNDGNADTPSWVQLGDVANNQADPVTFPGGVSGKGFSAASVVSGGGTGMLADEYNVIGYDGSSGSAIIGLSTDPTDTPPSQNYVRGTLLLRNDESSIGQLWLKTGEGIGDWTRVALLSDLA